jgi:excisionase family DNA binding protein
MADDVTVERLAFSPTEAAQSINLSVGTIYKLLKTGRLSGIRCERRILISRDNLIAFLNEETERRRGFLEKIRGINK